MTEEKIKEVLQWIIQIFEQYGIRYQITGGLAARAYGSTRPLHDMDFDVETGSFGRILPEVEKYIAFGPAQYEEKEWSNFLLCLDYEGMRMNLSESSTKIFDRKKSVWTDWPVNFDTSTSMHVSGLFLPVISLERLLAYKKVLARPQDELDRKVLENML